MNGESSPSACASPPSPIEGEADAAAPSLLPPRERKPHWKRGRRSLDPKQSKSARGDDEGEDPDDGGEDDNEEFSSSSPSSSVAPGKLLAGARTTSAPAPALLERSSPVAGRAQSFRDSLRVQSGLLEATNPKLFLDTTSLNFSQFRSMPSGSGRARTFSRFGRGLSQLEVTFTDEVVQRQRSSKAASTSSAYEYVVALDVNGTIIEGDSLVDNAQPLTLTKPARELLSYLREAPVRIIIFTFGRDWPIAVELVEANSSACFTRSNMFFIARASHSREIWAFPMPESNLVDFTSRNPLIGADIDDVELLKTNEEVEAAMQQDARCDAYRFQDNGVFKRFVDILLQDGDVVFRAAYGPGNSYFASRKSHLCKVLLVSVPMIVYDDHEDDWDIGDCVAKVVHVVTPAACEVLNTPNPNDQHWLQKYQREVSHQKASRRLLHQPGGDRDASSSPRRTTPPPPPTPTAPAPTSPWATMTESNSVSFPATTQEFKYTDLLGELADFSRQRAFACPFSRRMGRCNSMSRLQCFRF
mmetsp:Transcript_60761/g.144711  ORF Transcript_60761/g.144711 Transcript_60761/m.144711 type:complete len:529 (+) Transcript_60761:124-1710(+)